MTVEGLRALARQRERRLGGGASFGAFPGVIGFRFDRLEYACTIAFAWVDSGACVRAAPAARAVFLFGTELMVAACFCAAPAALAGFLFGTELIVVMRFCAAHAAPADFLFDAERVTAT